jgi:hypothetical protein
MSSKDLLILTRIQESFEILNKLRDLPGNEELNDLWNNLLDIRNNQINVLKQNDLFGLFNSIKLINTTENSTQLDKQLQIKQKLTNTVVYYSDDK